jgi:alpha-glucosidase
MRDAFLLRYALIPYIYTAARAAYDTGISLCHPLYYDYPEVPEAYEFKDEYLFGSDMLVAPVATPLSEDTLLTKKPIWLPPGTWIEWFTGKELKGPAKIERTFALTEIPVYVKAGAIVPMQPKMRSTSEKPVDPLILTIFPGESGETRVYDDAGNTPGYQTNEFTRTAVRHSLLADGTQKIEILPVEGNFPGMLTSRGYEIRLPVTLPPDSVRANGAEISYAAEGAASGWRYDGQTLTTIISVPKMRVNQKLEVLVKSPAPPRELLDGVPGMLTRLRGAMDVLNTSWPQGWSPDILIDAAQAGRRMTLKPESAREELQKLEKDFPAIVEEIGKMDADCSKIVRALAQLGRAASCIPALKPATP